MEYISDITRITCECGTPILMRYYDEHLKSSKHFRLMAKKYQMGLLDHIAPPYSNQKNHYMLKKYFEFKFIDPRLEGETHISNSNP